MLCDGSGWDSSESWHTQAIGQKVVQCISKWACPDMFAYILLLLLGWQSSLSLACCKIFRQHIYSVRRCQKDEG